MHSGGVKDTPGDSLLEDADTNGKEKIVAIARRNHLKA